MLTSIVTVFVIAAMQVVSHKLMDRKLKELMRKADLASSNSGTAASHSAKAAAQADAAVMLLAPAVAQLPRTRARRSSKQS